MPDLLHTPDIFNLNSWNFIFYKLIHIFESKKARRLDKDLYNNEHFLLSNLPFAQQNGKSMFVERMNRKYMYIYQNTNQFNQ